MEKIDFFRMECFLAAAELGNMTKAAERMNITQPAMSFQIRELEREVQITLFTRDRNGIYLTEAGKIMRNGFIRILDNYQWLLTHARACAIGQPRLTIGFHGPVNWAGINHFIADFTERHPEVEIVILQQQWLELANYLELGVLDVAFLETAELGARKKLASFPLFRELTCFAISPDHPLAARESVEPEDLENETILTNSHPSASMTIANERLFRSGIRRENCRFFDQLDITLTMAAAKQGITCVPRSFKTVTSALHYVDYGAEACYMDYSLAWMSSNENPTLQLFCQEVREARWPYDCEL